MWNEQNTRKVNVALTQTELVVVSKELPNNNIFKDLQSPCLFFKALCLAGALPPT